MRLGPGKVAKKVDILSISELGPGEVENMASGSESPVKRLREVHHRIARLKALGLRNFEVARLVGYSETRISILCRSPAMANLISEYEGRVDANYEVEIRDAYNHDLIRARLSAQRQIADATEASEEGEIDPLPLRTLLSIHDSAADRTGYGKHSTVLNVNLDFASKLDKAVKRSSTVQKEPKKLIDVTPNFSGEFSL